MTDDLLFEPDEITISVGDTVVWENTGSVAHSVTAYEEGIPDDADYFASGGCESEQAARDGYSANDPESGAIPGEKPTNVPSTSPVPTNITATYPSRTWSGRFRSGG